MTKFALYSHTEGVLAVVDASDVATIARENEALILVTKDGRQWTFDFLEYVVEE